MKARKHSAGFAAEFRIILARARQVWRLVPRRHKGALGGGVLVIAVTSACCVAVPQLLGHLVDRVQAGVLQGWPGDALYRTAAGFLSLIALLYLPIYVLLGIVAEARIYVPYLFLLSPAFAKLWTQFLLAPNSETPTHRFHVPARN